VGGLWHGGGFKFHFNLLRDVIGHFFWVGFHRPPARSVPRCWAPCVLLASELPKLPRPSPEGVAWRNCRPVGVSAGELWCWI
jgi:hypothetical protein